MVALNEKFSQCWAPASEGRVSPDVIEGFDFTKGSEEVRGGSVVNFGGAGFRELSDASPLRRRSAAPVHRNNPETQPYYVRNRMYNRARYTVLRQELKSPGRPGRASKKIAVLREIQRDPIGCSGGINLYEYVGGKPASGLDGSGEKWVKLPYEICREYFKEPHWWNSPYDIHFAHAWIRRGTSGWGFYPKRETALGILCSPGIVKDNAGASDLPHFSRAPMGQAYKVCQPVWVNTCECDPKKATAGIAKAISRSAKHPQRYGIAFYDCIDWAEHQLTWGAISGCKGWQSNYDMGWGTLPVQISGAKAGGAPRLFP